MSPVDILLSMVAAHSRVRASHRSLDCDGDDGSSGDFTVINGKNKIVLLSPSVFFLVKLTFKHVILA